MHCAGWLRARCGAVARTGRRAGRLRAWVGRRCAGMEQSGCGHAAAGMRLRACCCGHAAARTRLRARGRAAARSEQGCGADGVRRRRARNDQSGCAHAAARTRQRARGSAHGSAHARAAARSEQGYGATGRGGCSNVAGRRRAQGARRGAATRMCISQNAAINCNLMCILKFSNVCFSNHRMLSKGYDTFNCNQMCILKFISRACVYVHTRKVRLVSRIALDQ